MKISDLKTTAQAATHLGINERTLRRHVAAGTLKPALGDGGSGRGFWFAVGDLEKLKIETGNFKTGRPKART